MEYNKQAIADKIRQTAKDQGVTVKQVLLDAGLSYNVMTTYRTSYPRADSLAHIADVLNCSVDYLLGRTDIRGVNMQ